MTAAMSADSRVVTALSMALVSFVRGRIGPASRPPQPRERHHLTEPQFGRFRRRSRETPAGGNVGVDVAGGGKLRALADRHVIAHPDAATQRHEISKRRTSGDSGLRHNDAMPANANIVADLDQIVDLGALADHGIADGATVDRGAGADLDVVLDDDAPELRHLKVAAQTQHEAEAVLTDLAARMNDDPVADQRVGDDGSRPDRTMASDAHLGADDCRCPDDGAGADFDPRPDHRAGLDGDAAFE